MSLDKAIKHGKEKRKPYRGSKAFDRGCRNHGICSYCRDNRTINNRRRNNESKQDIRLADIDATSYYYGEATNDQEALEAYYNQVCQYPV
jgi:hypothetical protein